MGRKTDETVRIEGRKLPPFTLHTMFVATVPGSDHPERLAIVKTLVTYAGELVFVTKPYPNLARK